jgi:hypothetical protein
LLHATVWSQLDELKRAEIHQGYLLSTTVPHDTCGTQRSVEEELMACKPQDIPLQVKVGLDVTVEGLHWIRIVEVGNQYDHTLLLTSENHI